MKNKALVLSSITTFYILALLMLMIYADKIAKSTNRGISPSEVLEGLVPGGLGSLLLVFIILLFITTGIWIVYLVKKQNLKPH